MNELLTLCGFTEQDIEKELPRVEKAFGKLGIIDADIEVAIQRLNKYYDMELVGVRKILRLCLLEVINSVLAREEGKKKIVFGFMIPGFEVISYALMSGSKEVFAAHHSWAFLLVMGCVFGKLVPVMEEAERKWLKAGAVAHCANLKTITGLVSLDLIPKPDLMLTSGFMCETAPKTLDLMHELYDMPVYCWDTCYDRGAGESDEAGDRSADLAEKSLRRLIEIIQVTVGFTITDDMLWDALEARNRLNRLMSKIQHLHHDSDPLPISPAHDNFWMILNSLTFHHDNITDAIDAAETLLRELKERVEKGYGVMPKGSPRVVGEMFAHHADPRLEYLACEMGIALVVATTASTIRFDRDLEDPYKAISMAWGGARSAGYAQKIPMELKLFKKMKIDGFLERYHVGCRDVVGDAFVIQNAVEKELGIPVLSLEWENFDPRVYNHEEYRRRLEVFKTMMTRKAD